MNSQIIKKISVVSVILVGLISFLICHNYYSSFYEILKIISPTEIVADINHNGSVESNETIKISKMYVPNDFSSIDDLKKIKNIEKEFYYLSEQFANSVLKGQKIKIKQRKTNSEIFVNGQSYNKLFAASGFAFYQNKSLAPLKTKEIINLIKTQEYRILNLKNNKYHTFDCKYATEIQNIKVIPLKEVSTEFVPCRLCHPQFKKEYTAVSKYIPLPPLIYEKNCIKMFLTDYTTVIKPSDSCNTSFCKELVSKINNTQKSIDIAIYGAEYNSSIYNAVENALSRGVKIRMVYDIDSRNQNIYKGTLKLATLIKDAKNDGGETAKSTYVMHNKFIIFDDKSVMTGSANLSKSDLSGFNTNNIVFINSDEIAKIYKKEFEQMYEGKFHNRKLKISGKTNISLGNSIVSIYFSPKDKQLTNNIIYLIDNAEKTILVPAFLITDKATCDALIRAKSRGVDVRVITDAANSGSKYSKHRVLRAAKIPVKTEIFAGKLHSKTMIIDKRYSVIGSMNFSYSGENKNDENTVIIDCSELASFYTKFFDYIWQKIPDKWLILDARAEGSDSSGSCTDGVDNDFDGYTDIQDPSCNLNRI